MYMARNSFLSQFLKSFLTAILFFTSFITTAQWKVETSGGSQGYRNAVRHNSTGDVYVVLQDASNSYKATVQKKNGVSWSIVGTAGFSTYMVYEPSIAINQSNGEVFVTYIESIGGIYKLSCNKFDGSSWVDVGTPEFVITGATGKPGITIDNLGNPVIVTPFYSGFYVYQYNGSSWVNLTANPPLATPATTPLDILYQQGGNGAEQKNNYFPVVGSDGSIYVAVSSPYIGNDGVIVMKYASGAWTKVGNNLPGGSITSLQRVVFAPNGDMYVAYATISNSSSFGKIYVHKWNGLTWVDITAAGTKIFNSTYNNFNSFSFDIAFDSNSIPYVIFQNTGNDWRANLRKYNSSTTNWDLTQTVNSNYPGFAMDAGVRLFFDSNNSPFYVTTNSSEPKVFVAEKAPVFRSFSPIFPTSGAIGATTTLSGVNFTGTTDVQINGVSATYTVVDDNTITVTIPSGATSGVVSVTNAFGTTSTSTYTVVVPATITSFSPTSGSIGSTVTITGTNFTGATAVKFNGVAATTFTVVSATSITAVVPTGATTGAISVTTPASTVTSSSNFTVVIPPSLSSITPTNAEVGDVVTISGTGFDATASNNIVYFGNVQAKVNAATTSSLSVIVPNGSTRDFISVVTNGYVLYSSKKFNLINKNIGAITTSPLGFTSVGTVANIAGGGESAGNTNDIIVGAGDFDNDGWSDIFKGGVNNISVNRNLLKGTNTTLSSSHFSSATNYAVSGTVRTVAVADVDGDGKLDIITGSTSGLSILRNTSNYGSISFAAAVNISTSTTSIRVADFNYDGKVDIAAVSGGNLNIFSNNSTLGSIAFNSPVATALSTTGFYGLDLGDLNNDGKVDIVVSLGGTTNVIINNSTAGNLALTNSFTIAIGHVYVIVDDLDKDGNNDIYLYNKYLKNGFVSGTLTSANFTTYTNSLVDEGSSGSSSVDLNGDAYPEIFLGAWWSHLWLYINNATGTPASIFSNRQTFVRGNAEALDINGDQKVDMITSNVTDATIGITQNTMSPASGVYATCSLNAFTQCSASPSTSQTISVSGTGLTSDISIAAAPNFEYSLDNTTFSSSLTLPQVSGTVAATTVYVRYNRADLGSEKVDITLSSSIAAGARKLIIAAFGSRSLATISGNTSLAIGQTTTLTGSPSPSTTTPWTSSNTAVASVNSSGVVTGVSSGTVTITYTNLFGCQATQSINILPPPTITSFTPTSCPVGTTVTITGTNFTGATAVKFNGTSAISFTVVSATSITATVPVGATTGTISVTNSVGTATSAGTLTVTIAPPVVTSFSPNAVAPGDTVTIVGTGFDPTISNNVVLLDGMKCLITTASSTSLSVIIPKGTTYNNFQVVNVTNKLSAISKSKIIIKSATLGAQVVSNSFYLNTPASLSNVVVTSEKNYSTADIDTDGKLDILAMNNGYSLKIAATSSTPSSLNYTVNTISNSVLPVANAVRYAQLRDYNNDGLLDLMTTEPGTSTTGGWVNINNSSAGTPSFNTRYTLTPSLTYNFLATDVITSDFNNDGRIDILGAYRTDSYFTFCKNNSTNGVYSEVSTRGQGASASNLVTAAIEGEFTGDSKVDFFVLHGSVGDFVTNNTSYDASSLSISVSPSINLSASILRTADLDNDGDLDIIATNTTSTINILTNNGTGTFTTSSINVPSGSLRGIQLGDLDGDGDVDIVYATSTGFYYLPNTTSTSNSIVFNISSNVLLSNSITSYGFKLVDLTEDNKFDILYSTGTALNILINKIGQIPTVTLTNSNLSTFNSCIGNTSVSQNFILSATNLTANVNVAALTGYEYSLNDTTYSSTLSIPFGNGSLTNIPIYVRLTNASSGNPTGSIVLSSTGATNQTLTVSGNVTSIPLPTVSTPTVQSFTTLGASTWTAPAGVTSVEYIVVGGAGGGATGYDNAGGGGGGAGMVLTGRLSVSPGTSYPIVIGDGGIGGANARANNWGVNGENSSFATITALGGNRGKGCRSIDIAGVSQSSNCSSAIGGGGSGGGFGGKGGGGAFGNGANNSAATGGTGGAGINSSITGISVTYGIGGAGGNNGTVTTGTNGTANTGNGGKGGSASSASSAAGGKGGSGIVVIKYATQSTSISYCQNQTALPLQANATSGNILQWYTVATGGTASSSAPTPNTSSTGSTIYYVSQKDTTNGCESARLAITVTVNSIPTAPTTTISSVDYCQSGTATTLAATATSGNMLQWFLNSTVQPSCTPTPSTTSTGSFNYNAIQISSAGCESPATTITVNVFANPTAPVVSNDTLCINSVASPLTATANSGNTLQWYTAATGGTATTTAFTPSTAVSGTINYYVSQKTDSTGCESPRSTIGINVPIAPYPYDRAVNFTSGGHLTKVANASINLTDWTVEAWIYPTAWNTLGGIVSKRDFQFTTNANGALSVMIERNWSWELATTANNVITLNKWQHVAASYNSSTKVVKIYVDGVLVYTFTRSQTFVPDFNTYDFKVGYNNGQGNGTPNRTFAGNIDEVKVWNVDRTDNQISSNYTTELIGTENNLIAYYKFDQGIGGGNNTAITSLTDLTANANHLTPTSSSPVYAMNGAINNILQIGPAILSSPSICLNTTSTLTHTNSGGSWSSSDTTIISINSTTGSASALAVGTATITYTFTSNGCTFTSTKLFTVLDVPTVTIHPSTSTQNVCINTAATALSVTATGAGLTYQWYKNSTSSSTGGTLISGATSANYTPVTSVAGTLYYYCIVSGTCSPADTSNISGGIIVSPVSVAGTVSGTSSICSGSTTTLTLSGNVGTTIQWQRFDNPIWTDLTGETAATFTTPALTATTTYRASVTSGACVAAFTAGKVITVNPLPVISGLTTVGAGNQITLTATTTAASSNAWVSTNTSTLTVSNLGVVTGITPGNAAVIFTNNSGCKDTLDITVSVGTTLTPILTSPATNTTGATTLTINYTLPETPFAGSVSLTFTPVSGGTPIVWTMNNLTNPTFNYVVGSNPLTISNVVSGTALSFTTYNITLAYQDVYSNPAASVTNTNIQTLAPPNISFVNTSFATIVNTSFTINTINTGGSMVTYSISPTLPSGFTINTSTGVISGSSSVPLTTTTFTVTATNAAGTDTESFNFTIGADTDGDGIPDIADADVNGDGIPDNGTDTDGDGIIDQYDNDIDGDGIPNNLDNDADGDGLINPQDICWLTPNTAITVHPSTINQVICPSATIGALTVTATGPGLTYQWYKNTTNSTTGGTLIAGATAASYTPLNSVVGTVYYYVVVVGTCGSDTSNTSGSILVTDVTLPTVITQNKTVYLNAAGQATITPTQIDNGSTDNCSIATRTLNISSFNCSNIGANTVILSVTDASGNVQTGNATVTVIDTIKPTVVTQNITVYLNTAGTVSITPAQIDNGSTDNCAIATMSLDVTNFSCSNTGANTVTLTVTDVNGNIKTKTAIVTVVDSILPTVITQNAILYLNASGQASITAAQINNGSFDNCGVASVVLSQTAFTCSNVGSNTVTLTVTDTKGNVATGNAIVTIVDNTSPTAVVQNINAYLNTGGAVTITPSQVGGNSTDNCSIATMTLNNTTFNCSNLGPNAVVLTLVDPSNNVTTANATITVIDSVKPLLTIPSDITVFTNSGCGAFGFPIGSASASDNCSVISAITNNAPAFYPVGITNIQYSVTDGSGNTTIKIQKVTVIDNIIPVITAPANINTTLTAGCTKTGINLGTPVTSDNCTIASVTNDAPTAFPVGTTTVTWIVTDASGNTATATQTVTVTDAINPTITAPSNITVNANSSCVAFNVALGTPVTADNCTVASVTNNAPAVFTLGTTTVTWTVTDASGNTANVNQTVTVVDNINPSIIAPAAITKNLLSGCTYSSLTLGTPFTLDNCSIATITNNAPTTFPIGTTTVVWTVTDGSGNIATANQLITIVDNINPTITAPAAVTMNVVSGCSATGVVLGTPITADNCSVASVTNNAPATFPIGTTTVTWTVTDASGKTATANQLVTIVDNINPTISAPAAVSVNLTNGCAASNVVLGTPITADNCSVASITNNAPAIFQLGTTTVTWTVTDASGNSATSNQTVTVIDNINPTIVAPAAISMNVTSGCNVTGLALGSPFTSDNCSVATVANNAPTTFPIGTTTVVWTVTDGSGHTATANQLVTIVDNINPTITAPAAVTMNVVSGCSATGVVLGTPITADNCSVASVTNNAPATFPIGTTTVVWTVTDASGKTATATQLVTIVDNINPTITAPAAVSVTLTNGCTASNVVLGTPITADNCSVASVTNNAPAIFQLGTTTVTWTVTDASGLTATSNQTVTVIDNINPSIVAPAAISMNITSGCSVTGLALGTPYTADNCSVASVTNNAPTTFPIGTTTVIWTVTDGSGHTATATQLVTIVDNINPTITAPAAINSYIASGCSATGIVLGTPVTADNCSVASVTNNAPTSFPIGTTTVIWTVTDASGNTHTANQLVTVNDTLDPVITSPAAVTAYSNFGCQSVGVNLGTLTATDNCAIESITNNAPLFFPLGNTNVVWTVIDASGNSSTVTQLVTVVDTLKPTIIAPSNLEVASNTGCGASEISIGNPIVDDNCGVATINNDAPVVFVSGINIVTWTVTDNAGNVSTATQIVTVIDNVNPTAVLNNITVSLPVGSDAVITSDMIDNGSFDNCGNVTITLSQTNFNCDNIGNNTILVTVTDESGNFVSQSVVVTVNPSGIDLDLDGIDDACDQLIDQTVNVPNGFTPDGDGINDKFVVVGLDSYTSKALTIYNRYGIMVYETNNYQNDWDGSSNGSELPDGTYFYILELNGSETKSGYVYINRVH